MTSLYGTAFLASASFTRPNDTNQYAAGDNVSNNTVGSSVTPLSFTFTQSSVRPFYIKRGILNKSLSVTASAAFLLHLYSVSPAMSLSSAGDNAALRPSAATISGYLGTVSITITQSSSAANAAGIGAVTVGNEPVALGTGSGFTIYGLVEAAAAYTPPAVEQYTFTLEGYHQ